MDVAAAEATVVTVPAMKSTANRKRIIEAVVLSLVLLLVWVVFAIPTIIYAFPLINVSPMTDYFYANVIVHVIVMDQGLGMQ